MVKYTKKQPKIFFAKNGFLREYCSLKNSSNIFIFTYGTNNYNTQRSRKFEVILTVSSGDRGSKLPKKTKIYLKVRCSGAAAFTGIVH